MNPPRGNVLVISWLAFPSPPKQVECVSFRVVGKKELVALGLTPELLATGLREFALAEPHAARLLIELNPGEGDGASGKIMLDVLLKSLSTSAGIIGLRSSELDSARSDTGDQDDDVFGP